MTICLFTDDDKSSPLMDLEQSPFKEQPKKQFKPRSTDLCEEIVRRWRLYYRDRARFPRPAQWAREKMLEWLVAHPISSMDDIVYIHGVVTSLSRTLSSELEASVAARSGGNLETSVTAGSSGQNLEASVAAGSSGQNLEASVTAGGGGRNLETSVTAGGSGRKCRKRSDSMTSSSNEGDLEETRKKDHTQKKIAVAVNRLAVESRLTRLSTERENRLARNSTETLSRRKELCSRRDLLERNIKDLKSTVRTYMMDRLRSQDPEERSHYQSFIDEDNIAIKQAQTELDKIVKMLDAMSDN